MKILITGLTLHNNKGGAALALSLIVLLKKEFINSQYFLSVPNFKNNLELEEKWAKFYGISGVVGAVGVKEMLYINQNRRDIFEKFLANIDLIIDLNALSYMDLPNLNYKKNLIRNLSIYTIRYFANKLNIPLIRWTQSYGPFSSFITKQLVKHDLKNQKNIFVRGESSKENMKYIFKKNKNIISFPDIAITLKKNEIFYNNHLKNSKYISISPSSVLYSIKGDGHIKDCIYITEYLLKKGYQVVFVPHNMMLINPSLHNCDLEVSKTIIEKMNNENIFLIKDDLDVYQLKGVIANAELHIGARYHSIIASLSTTVPTIAMSWHEKYKDIMSMYDVEKYIITNDISDDMIIKYIDILLNNKTEIQKKLKVNQNKLLVEINENLNKFKENYNDLQIM